VVKVTRKGWEVILEEDGKTTILPLWRIVLPPIEERKEHATVEQGRQVHAV
jgi:hypothetical protein